MSNNRAAMICESSSGSTSLQLQALLIFINQNDCGDSTKIKIVKKKLPNIIKELDNHDSVRESFENTPLMTCQPVAAPSGESLFLRLPLEVRTIIYTMVLRTEPFYLPLAVPTCLRDSYPFLPSRLISEGLLRVNHQVHDEAVDLLYSSNFFMCQNTTMLDCKAYWQRGYDAVFTHNKLQHFRKIYLIVSVDHAPPYQTGVVLKSVMGMDASILLAKLAKVQDLWLHFLADEEEHRFQGVEFIIKDYIVKVAPKSLSVITSNRCISTTPHRN